MKRKKIKFVQTIQFSTGSNPLQAQKVNRIGLGSGQQFD